MPSDNEIMVLIYETVQKQLNQLKDSRVVMQTLAARVGSLESSVDAIKEQSSDIAQRLENLEMQVARMNANSDKKLSANAAASMSLKNTVDAMRGTLENVTNPSVKLISDNSCGLKDTVRELKSVQDRVNDEFEQYSLRLMRLEDSIDKMLKKQLLAQAAKQEQESAENE